MTQSLQQNRFSPTTKNIKNYAVENNMPENNNWRMQEHPYPRVHEQTHHHQERPVNIEKIYLSWNFLKAIGWIVAFAVGVITITINIYAFWSQAEIFRNDMRAQVETMNVNLKAIGDKLDALSSSPDLVRLRDLSEFCYLLEKENGGAFKCPPAFAGFGINRRATTVR